MGNMCCHGERSQNQKFPDVLMFTGALANYNFNAEEEQSESYN